MSSYRFKTVDVFTDWQFGGNPLAVFTDARGLTDQQMQALAAEFNLSETTFVLPPQDPANTARVRIFTPKHEMPFAGHPMVGTGYVLASQDVGGDELRFEVPAGIVSVHIERGAAGAVAGATIQAPRPLAIEQDIPVETIAACAGIEPSDVVTTSHRPLMASMGTSFVFAEVSADALARAVPRIDQFQKAAAGDPALAERLSLYLYVREGLRVRCRMFAPLGGVIEDPATGSANVTLAGLLLQLDGADRAEFEATQGVEMGRPSLLRLTAWRAPDGIRASVGGSCVPVLSGEALA